MEPISSAEWTGAPVSTPPPAPHSLPRIIVVGLILVGLGAVFTGISYGWNYFGIRSGFSSDFITYVQMEITLSVIQYLCIELGLFFIFLGILRLLPIVRPWSRVGPSLILAGALVTAGVNLTYLALITLTYPSSAFQIPEWAGNLILGTMIVGYMVATVGLLLSLFAVAKGVVLRTVTTTGSQLP